MQLSIFRVNYLDNLFASDKILQNFDEFLCVEWKVNNNFDLKGSGIHESNTLQNH